MRDVTRNTLKKTRQLTIVLAPAVAAGTISGRQVCTPLLMARSGWEGGLRAWISVDGGGGGAVRLSMQRNEGDTAAEGIVQQGLDDREPNRRGRRRAFAEVES